MPLLRPTDAAYAFTLKTVTPRLPSSACDIRDVAREALEADSAARFESRVSRWLGPENELGGEQPYAIPQTRFEEWPWRERFTRADAEPWLRGTVTVLRHPTRGTVDYVMRDHHMVDVALYHHLTTGVFPHALFHADRHSDWCKDGFLLARKPDQAATWWALLQGLKRPGGETPFLAEDAIHFTTAHAEVERDGQRDIGAHALVPWFVDETAWEQVLARPAASSADWVSLDLDNFQPAAQLRLTRGLLRDERFQMLLRRARVRVFVLSPQFIRGGDRLKHWRIDGSICSSVRLLNWLRAER